MAKRKGVYARDIDKLNIIFAAVTIASLLSVVWMIWDDYAREWKRYQRQFQVIEQEVTQQQLANEQASINQTELAQLTQQRAAAEQTLAGQEEQVGALEAELEGIQTELELATQKFRFARSVFDTQRWNYEEAIHKNSDSSGEEADYREAEARLAETQAEEERLQIEADRIQGELDTLRQSLIEAEVGIGNTTREIDRLQGRLDSLRFDVAYAVRNAPMLDALNPSQRIRQAVINDLRLDLNFADAPRVDRCQTCHLGASNGAYANSSQPFTSHPNLDLYVADTSVHPAGEFGCAVCHQGKGLATSFYSAVHTPSNESEEHRWEEEHGWSHIELWEWPMRKVAETEASCLK